MRNRTVTRTLQVVLVPLLAVVFTACSSDPEVVNTADEPAATASQSDTTTTARPAPTTTAAPRAARVGDALTVKDGDGVPIEAVLVQVIDPATSSSSFSKPKEGGRFVAVQLRLTNKGTAVIDEFPGNDVKIIDAKGQQYRTTYGSMSGCQDFGGSVKLAPGALALGCIAFEVPSVEQPAKVQFTPSSGFADQTAEWTL